MVRQAYDDGEPDRADGVGEVDDQPVAQHLGRGDAPVGPGHDQEVVAGEELGPRDDDQDQPEREGEPGQDATGREPQARVGEDHHAVHPAQADEAPGEHPEHGHRQERQARLGHASGLDLLGDLLRGESVRSVMMGPMPPPSSSGDSSFGLHYTTAACRGST